MPQSCYYYNTWHTAYAFIAQSEWEVRIIAHGFEQNMERGVRFQTASSRVGRTERLCVRIFVRARTVRRYGQSELCGVDAIASSPRVCSVPRTDSAELRSDGVNDPRHRIAEASAACGICTAGQVWSQSAPGAV